MNFCHETVGLSARAVICIDPGVKSVSKYPYSLGCRSFAFVDNSSVRSFGYGIFTPARDPLIVFAMRQISSTNTNTTSTISKKNYAYALLVNPPTIPPLAAKFRLIRSYDFIIVL